jgi:ribosomal protein L7/L12
MTRDELISEFKRRSENGEGVEAAIGNLRAIGCSKIESIAVLIEAYGIGLAKAKELVHLSPTWADRKVADDKFHDDLIDALTKDGR